MSRWEIYENDTRYKQATAIEVEPADEMHNSGPDQGWAARVEPDSVSLWYEWELEGYFFSREAFTATIDALRRGERKAGALINAVGIGNRQQMVERLTALLALTERTFQDEPSSVWRKEET